MPIFLFILLLLAATSCSTQTGQEIDTRLASAETLMKEHPDSALAILNDIRHPLHSSNDSLSLNSENHKALYALLLTQARHKNYIDETNDSLISTAVSYFDRKDDAPRLMKSLFYHATINSNDKNYPPAMTSAMRALQLANDLNDIYWQARISELIGYIFAETYFFEEAAEYCENAAKLFQQAGATKPYLYALSDIASDYCNMHDYNHALILIDSIRKQTSDQYLISYCSSIALFSLYELGEYTKAVEYADSLIAYSDSGFHEISSHEYSKIVCAKLLSGNTTNVRTLLYKARSLAKTENDTLSYYVGLLNLYKSENNIRLTNSILSDILSLQNKISRQIRQQSSIVAQRNFYSAEAADANFIATKRKYAIIIGLTISISIIIVLILLFRYQIQLKNTDIEHKVAQLLLLTTEAEQNKSKLSSLSSFIDSSNLTIKELTNRLNDAHNQQDALIQLSHTLFQKRLNQLNMLINEFYESDGSKESRQAIYKNIEQEIKKLINKKNLNEIESIVNSCLDNIVTKMQTQLKDFTPEDISFLTLSIAGYGARAIALFTGIKPNSTYTKKKRLISRIANSDAIDKDWFIHQINNPLSD